LACCYRAKYGERGESIKDSNFLLLMNAHHEEVPFTLPDVAVGGKWRALVDTTWMDHTQRSVHEKGSIYPLHARSLVLLVEHRGVDRRGES
jgi:glycogen operon protein